MRSLEGGIDKVTRKCLKNAFSQSLNEWKLFYAPFFKKNHTKNIFTLTLWSHSQDKCSLLYLNTVTVIILSIE